MALYSAIRRASKSTIPLAVRSIANAGGSYFSAAAAAAVRNGDCGSVSRSFSIPLLCYSTSAVKKKRKHSSFDDILLQIVDSEIKFALDSEFHDSISGCSTTRLPTTIYRLFASRLLQRIRADQPHVPAYKALTNHVPKISELVPTFQPHFQRACHAPVRRPLLDQGCLAITQVCLVLTERHAHRPATRTASESRTCHAKPVPSWHNTADIRQGPAWGSNKPPPPVELDVLVEAILR
ncbi:hypothetical protein HAX54_042689 [Datura stramonium]|uniref:Uncharacterized protein n=1 Tax=Datura stramonium TaxID=4076 RepID=A0ABS8W082_DATST|nr:hypothetical protein [Datura stramonium]